MSEPGFPRYAEDRAALRPVALACGLGLPVVVVLAALAGALTGSSAVLVVAAVAVFGWIFSGGMYLYVHWPAGIRIDQDGVRIGNVRRPDANRRHPPAPSFQAYRVFTARWTGVRSLRVTVDRRELRQLARQSRQASTRGLKARGGNPVGFYLGMLTPPFLRAALVIEVDADGAEFPEFRARQASSVGGSQLGTRSLTWVAPTRRPAELAAVVDAITGSRAWTSRYTG